SEKDVREELTTLQVEYKDASGKTWMIEVNTRVALRHQGCWCLKDLNTEMQTGHTNRTFRLVKGGRAVGCFLVDPVD
ncbi:hypothetical protein BDZ89DRAFT_1069031, partial [Hymenopellis radicata]